jgi:hypothetical protein
VIYWDEEFREEKRVEDKKEATIEEAAGSKTC